MQNEAVLVEQALQGNAQAFGELVRAYQDRLYTSMVHVVGCREEAYDVVQDAFVQALKKLKTFRRNSSFYTWLYRIAFNTAVNRRRRRQLEREILAGGHANRPSAASPPGEELMRQERVARVHSALDTLSEEHRAILVLREMEGCDYEMIAEILGLQIGTVRSRLHRARLQLKSALDGQLHEEGDAVG